MTEYIGTQVNVPGTRGKAILRYQGSIHGKNGVFAGLELLGPIALTRGKNNGDVEGFKYFQVQHPMSGLFIPFERLRSVNPNLEFTKDMINEVNHDFHNDSLDDEISYVPDYNNLSRNHLSSPTPQLSSQLNSSIPRPYSADVSKTRTQSPLLSNGSLTLPKRQTQASISGSNTNTNTITNDRSRTSSFSSYNRSPLLNSTTRSYSLNLDPKFHSPVSKRYSNGLNSFLEQELYELKSKYERNERDMIEKMSILNELRETVQELQPILKQYENELSEKDRKIAKIRNEFDVAREDWRQNLDIMVNTYEANENFYESKIKELQLKITENSPVHSPVPDSTLQKQFDSINSQYNQLIKDKEELDTNLHNKIQELETQLAENDSKQLNNKILQQQHEIESLSKELMEIHKFPNDDNSSHQKEMISQLQNELESLTHVKQQVSNLENENSQLKRELERRHSFEKLEDKNKELTRLQDTINELKDQISSKDKEIIELEDNLDAKIKELNSKAPSVTDTPSDELSSQINELKEDMSFKDQEIKALQQQLDKSNETINTQKQRLKSLEANNKSNSNDDSHTNSNGSPGDNSMSMKDTRIKELEQEINRLTTNDSDSSKSINKQLVEKDHIIQELERKLQESLTSELDSLNINDAAAINEMTFKRDIDNLKSELEARPTIEELTELQDNIDEMVRLHNNEIFFKDEEIQRIINENSKLQVRLERALEGTSMGNRISDNASYENTSISSELPVYRPEVELDPSYGKDNWCGLCERDGHSSLNCPYENEIF